MSLASFDGLPLWGLAVRMQTSSNPPGGMSGAYPLVAGSEWLALGSRGRRTAVQGWISGADGASFEAVCATFRGYQESGYVGALVTTTGRVSAFCRIAGFGLASPVFFDWNDGSVFAAYQAVVEELV